MFQCFCHVKSNIYHALYWKNKFATNIYVNIED